MELRNGMEKQNVSWKIENYQTTAAGAMRSDHTGSDFPPLTPEIQDCFYHSHQTYS